MLRKNCDWRAWLCWTGSRKAKCWDDRLVAMCASVNRFVLMLCFCGIFVCHVTLKFSCVPSEAHFLCSVNLSVTGLLFSGCL